MRQVGEGGKSSVSSMLQIICAPIAEELLATNRTECFGRQSPRPADIHHLRPDGVNARGKITPFRPRRRDCATGSCSDQFAMAVGQKLGKGRSGPLQGEPPHMPPDQRFCSSRGRDLNP